MEEINFIDERSKTTINFTATKELLNWPVPREGETITVRGPTDDITGIVEQVDWYYSMGNRGPVVKVYVNTK